MIQSLQRAPWKHIPSSFLKRNLHKGKVFCSVPFLPTLDTDLWWCDVCRCYICLASVSWAAQECEATLVQGAGRKMQRVYVLEVKFRASQSSLSSTDSGLTVWAMNWVNRLEVKTLYWSQKNLNFLCFLSFPAASLPLKIWGENLFWGFISLTSYRSI